MSWTISGRAMCRASFSSALKSRRTWTYQEIYNNFKKQFGELPHAIGGAQLVAVNDPNVLGFVPKQVHEMNMRQFRVMYYHSTEPNHVHYHPFEAVQVGMPLVFQGGGLLDRLGGRTSGRCRSVAEARDKIKRILDGDRRLIDDIRASQSQLLKPMSFASCEPAWRAGFKRIMAEMDSMRLELDRRVRKKRIAVILPTYIGAALFEVPSSWPKRSRWEAGPAEKNWTWFLLTSIIPRCTRRAILKTSPRKLPFGPIAGLRSMATRRGEPCAMRVIATGTPPGRAISRRMTGSGSSAIAICGSSSRTE